MSSVKNHYSVSDIEKRILEALHSVGLDTDQRLSHQALAALDHFHTGGYPSSLRLQEMSKVKTGDRVLDLGAGLAGPARMLADFCDCQVDCIDLSPDYCVGAELLNRLTGLEDKVKVFTGSVLDMPFDDQSFDIAWMQNVGMNIEDKQTFYREIRRVLKPGGRFAFQEMMAGKQGISAFPLPWASGPDENFLISSDVLHDMLNDIGFEVEIFEDASQSQLGGSSGKSSPTPAQAPLSLSTYVDNLAQKAENAQRSLQDGEIVFVRAVFRAK